MATTISPRQPYCNFPYIQAPIDDFSCFLTTVSEALYNHSFGYISSGLLILIIIISIFGTFQGYYRWLILNQVIWDLAYSHYYCCQNIVEKDRKLKSSGFCLLTISTNDYFNNFLLTSIQSNIYSGLLLLTFFRFISVYFLKTITKTRTLLFIILVYNFGMIMFHSDNVFRYFRDERTEELYANFRANYSTELYLLDPHFQTLDVFVTIFRSSTYLKPGLCLLPSIIMGFMIVFKIIKQAQFQSQHNLKDYKNSVRIATVIALQNSIILVIFIFSTLYDISEVFKMLDYVVINPTFGSSCAKNAALFAQWIALGYNFQCIEYSLPLWIAGDYGIFHYIQTIVQIRIFIEALIILFIMTGYRENIMALGKFIFELITHPKIAYNNVTQRSNQSKVVSISGTNI